MGKGKSSSRLGISLGGEALQVAEVQHAGDRSEILGLTTVPLEQPFSFRTISNEDAQADIATLLRQAVDDAGMNATEAVLSIDSTMALVKRLPFDASLKTKEITHHVPWELQQYLLSPLEDYVFDFQKFTMVNGDKVPHFIMVAVKKPIIETVKHIAEMAELKASVVDVDILAAVNAFEVSYSVPVGEYSALVEVGETKLNFVFLNGHNFIGHHPVYVEDATDMDEMAKEISRSLRLFASDFLTEDSKRQFDRVYLYRPADWHNLDDLMGAASLASAEILNPLAAIPVSVEVEEAVDLTEDQSHFTEAIGLGLRR